MIDIASRRYHTTAGIHVGSPMGAVHRAYPEAVCGSLSGGKPGQDVCNVTSNGGMTSFGGTTSQRVWTIEIGRDRSAQS